VTVSKAKSLVFIRLSFSSTKWTQRGRLYFISLVPLVLWVGGPDHSCFITRANLLAIN